MKSLSDKNAVLMPAFILVNRSGTWWAFSLLGLLPAVNCVQNHSGVTLGSLIFIVTTGGRTQPLFIVKVHDLRLRC